MSRIRTIKPEFFRDPKVAKVSRDARYLMVGLLTEADDEGRMLGSSKLLAGSLYPHDPEVSPGRVTRWLEELDTVDLIRFYDVDDIGYIHVPNFLKHQRISHPTPSKLPFPPDTVSSSSGASPELLVPEQGTGNREVELEVEQGTGSTPTAYANGNPNQPTDDQLYLLKRLFERDSNWSEVTIPALVQLNKRYGRETVHLALGRLRESPPVVVGKAYGLLRGTCEAVQVEAS